MKYLQDYKLFENNKNYWGHSYSVLLNIIEDEVEEDPEEHLDYILKDLKKIEKQKTIKLFRVIYTKNKEDIDETKLGHHFVKDPEDFHEHMLGYLYTNARKENPDLKETDCWLVEIEVETKYIDFSWTLMTNCEHPFESEITIETSENVKIINITSYYDN